jgi:hypothetical protein
MITTEMATKATTTAKVSVSKGLESLWLRETFKPQQKKTLNFCAKPQTFVE